MNKRSPKKSETLEVRLTHETKQAFMSKAAVEGRSASEIVRDLVANYCPRGGKVRFRFWWPALGLVLAPLLMLSTATVGPKHHAHMASTSDSTRRDLEQQLSQMLSRHQPRIDAKLYRKLRGELETQRELEGTSPPKSR